MRRYLPVMALLILTSCWPPKPDPEAAIRALIDSSQYTPVVLPNDSAAAPRFVADDFFLGPPPDSEPWVMFARQIDSVAKNVAIEIAGDSATALIEGTLKGTFWVDSDPHPGPYFHRPIADSFYRQVNFFKGESGWSVASLTPMIITTIAPQPPVTINKVEARVAKRHYTFTLTDPLTPLKKSELPSFEPGDTVQLTVDASARSDSTWVFFHHWDQELPYHHRDRLKKVTTVTFTGRYIVAEDALDDAPKVLHIIFDAIGWQSLFGNDFAKYLSSCWVLPCIIKRQNDPIPTDGL